MVIKNRLLIVLCFLFYSGYGAIFPENQVNLTLDQYSPIYTSARPGNPLYKAALALQRDMEKVLGGKHPILPLHPTKMQRSGIVIVNRQKDKSIPGTPDRPEGWEAHRVSIIKIGQQPQILAAGADMRGAIYAVYTISEKILGVPPLWYFSSWEPVKRKKIQVPGSLHFTFHSPSVRYRAWFPNDMDLFSHWRKKSAANDQLWLETALRLKLNTIEWFDNERDYDKPYSISRTTQLISDYGLINTSHHHSPLNASFGGWKDYWEKVRDTAAPPLLLANQMYLDTFWRYQVECITRHHIDMLWVLGFRGNGDHPFWYTFKDAPTSMQERGKVIDYMLAKQRNIVMSVTHNPKLPFRTIYYDELSDLLAKGYLHPPADSRFIRTYVAARRDHYPNTDIRELKSNQHLLLGYYFNCQFTSTGSHLVAGEGPWKMERNFRYVAAKTDRPLAYCVVNAGNIREFVMELSANAAMMWDMDSFTPDDFLLKFCGTYFGKSTARQAARLYKDYYHAFWNQRKPELKGFDRQFIFQDLRYQRAISEIAKKIKDNASDLNPLTDIPTEQVNGRTYRIIPENNGTGSQVAALLKGSRQSGAKFRAVATAAEKLLPEMPPDGRAFFSDNLRQPAYFMYFLNNCLFQLCKAYISKDHQEKKALIDAAIRSLRQAKNALDKKQHGIFADWYAGDRIFGFDHLFKIMNKIRS